MRELMSRTAATTKPRRAGPPGAGSWKAARRLDTRSASDLPIRDGMFLWVSVFDHSQTRHTRPGGHSIGALTARSGAGRTLEQRRTLSAKTGSLSKPVPQRGVNVNQELRSQLLFAGIHIIDSLLKADFQ